MGGRPVPPEHDEAQSHHHAYQTPAEPRALAVLQRVSCFLLFSGCEGEVFGEEEEEEKEEVDLL